METKMIVSNKKLKVNNPEKVYNLIKALLDNEPNGHEVEHFYSIGVNNKNVVQYIDLISLGTVNETLTHPREVFKNAIRNNCTAVIVAHNHPSGDVTPSTDDILTAERLIKAGKILGIPVHDNLIVSQYQYKSFKEHFVVSFE